MLRIILSIILGILFPIISLLVLSLLSPILPDFFSDDIEIFGEKAPGILPSPFFIAIYLDIFFRHYNLFPYITNTFWFRLISLISTNLGLYGIIAYFILGKFKRFKKPNISASNEPPPPNLYENSF